MSEEIPEEPPVEEPPVEEPLPPCPYPTYQAYRNETQALLALGRSRSRYVWACPAGHWHVLPKSNPDAVPNPDPTPVTAANGLGNVQERGRPDDGPGARPLRPEGH